MGSSRPAPQRSLATPRPESSPGTPRLFGTDGIRGIPGEFPLDRDSIVRIASAAAKAALGRGFRINGGPPFALIARDGRASGARLAQALAHGLRRAGVLALDVGIAPTPAISHLVPRMKACLGVSVSASHNPARYNGLKFFDAEGSKMDASLEAAIESDFFASEALPGRIATSGTLERSLRGADLYRDFLRSTFPAHLDFKGWRLVVDGANGAASSLAPRLLRGLGAQVIELSCSPDGGNINRGCGSVHPDHMIRTVKASKADGGLSFDGDADRVLLCDDAGRLWDGDLLLAFAARALLGRRRLRREKVVVTTKSNYGLLSYLSSLKIGTTLVPVGDRHVSEALEREDLSLGGEPSGHLVFWDWAKTGDGILTALQVLSFAREEGRSLSSLRPRYKTVPQVILNVPASEKPPLESLPRFQSSLKRARAGLRGLGRIVARYSGTEPLLRLMVEGPGHSRVRAIAKELEGVYMDETSEEADWDEL